MTVDQRYLETIQGRLSRNAGAGSPAPDHQQVWGFACQVPERRANGRVHPLSFETAIPVLGFEQRPSYWFTWHAGWIGPGARVLDVACGAGRHAIAAAELGATVVAVDRDPQTIAAGRREATRRGLRIEWIEADLEEPWPTLGTFNAVLVFNYLDRSRISQLVEVLRPGGILLMETFLEAQRHLGWGPQSDAHLLQNGELAELVAPLDIIHGREAFEPADNAQWAALASVLAIKK